MTTVENKHCTHKMQKNNTWSMRCASSSLFFDARTLWQQLNNGFVLNAGQHRKANISFFLLFLLKYSVLTHFPGPSVLYIVSLIHWMFCFWESSSFLPGRIGKIMVYFVLASENWKLSDEERVKKACQLCFRLGVFWCVNPRLGRTTRGGCPLSGEKTSAPAHFSNS